MVDTTDAIVRLNPAKMRPRKNLNLRLSAVLGALFACAVGLSAQSVIQGAITDRQNGEPLIGANVIVVGKPGGTITDIDGIFALETAANFPFRIRISYLGYQSEEMEIASPQGQLNVSLTPSLVLVNEIVVSASRLDERILRAPVTIEAMGQIDIRQGAAPDFYDGISNLKGVQTARGSLTFTSINTRGFGVLGNERFVQVIDGMDNAAPILNFPMGNIVGISDLDVARVELVPGAASALYGPNAFNGILIMESKNPFDYPGLSVETKGGMTRSDAGGANPYFQMAARYAQTFGKKFAFKADAAYLTATDWAANDYVSGRATLFNPNPSNAGASDFDGLNTYGDETAIVVPMAFLAGQLSEVLAPLLAAQFQVPVAVAQEMLVQNIPKLPTLNLRRTGFKEEDLLDSQDARSIKANAALHFRPTAGLEAIYQYRFGQGSTVFQGGDRFPLRDFQQQYHKVELRGGHFFARAYAAITNAGKSYNLTALGGYGNEAFKKSEDWVGEYAAAYASVLLPTVLTGGTPTEVDVAQANAAGRQFANRDIPQAGTPEFNAVMNALRSGFLQSEPVGARFLDRSRMYHVEGNYLFPQLAHIFELQIGGNFRRYDLFTDGTVLNENPDGEGLNERINIDEFGVYLQAGKLLANDKVKVIASVRYDENENFEGQFSPRVALMYSPDKEHKNNFRASYQTGFRNPSTQQQFIFFQQADSYLLGSAERNAARYGVHNGGAYSNSSYTDFIASVIAGQPDVSKLKIIDVPYVQPEQLQVFEVGYKGLIEQRLLLDVNVYHNRYRDFITQQIVRAKAGTTHQGIPLPGVDDMLLGNANSAAGFELYVNTPEVVTSTGAGMGLTFEVTKGFQLYGHYNYSSFDVKDPGPDFEARFNTPKHKFLAGLSNRKLLDKRLGFNISYRWQDAFRWQSSFGHADIPAFGVMDAQVSYLFRPLDTTLKIGGSNVLGSDYRTNAGGPFIGPVYYIGLTYNPVVR